ncbi:MAG: DNA-binding protein [Tissierellia bacterium]|nr:DNA-binding protein [Tissierellia bacterium]
MVEKLVEVGILFDFYGKLLSKKQFLAIELYYIHDLSLAEIGDELGITRQGVYDTLKRAEEKLYKYEKNLRLVEKFYNSHDGIRKIINISEEIMEIAEKNNMEDIYRKSFKISEISQKILNNSREVMD